MNILILGAAGRIGRLLTEDLLAQTDHHLILYAKDANSRLLEKESERVRWVEGDFKDLETLIATMNEADVVYINDLGDDRSTDVILEAMKNAGVKRVIGASILGIYDEVPGEFGRWNNKMIGSLPRMQKQIKSAVAIENSGLDYTLLRLTWLYNQPGNRDYVLTRKGDPFRSTQVTREAVSQLILDIIKTQDDRFVGESLGVGKPDTEWDKPSFY